VLQNFKTHGEREKANEHVEARQVCICGWYYLASQVIQKPAKTGMNIFQTLSIYIQQIACPLIACMTSLGGGLAPVI
jgi:hypothetical protein